MDDPELTSAITSFDVVNPGNVSELFAKYGTERAAKTAVGIIRDRWKEFDQFSGTLFFVLDVCRCGAIRKNLLTESDRIAFQADLIREGLIQAFRKSLSRPRMNVRHQTIPTIGRLCLEGGAQLLYEAFPWYLRNDPMGLHRLFGEYGWLRGDRLPLLAEAVSNANFSVRWSSLSFLDTSRWHCDQSKKQRYDDLLVRLTEDSHALVRENAQLVHAHVKTQSLEYESRRSQHRELCRLKKTVLTWDHVETRFVNRQSPDYTITEFEEFAENL